MLLCIGSVLGPPGVDAGRQVAPVSAKGDGTGGLEVARRFQRVISKAPIETPAVKVSTKRRECPKDWTPLSPEKVVLEMKRDVAVDRCAQCGGVFLDQDEIGKITGNRNLNTLLTHYVGIDSDSQRICPSCGGIMDAEDAGNVRVDVCLTCYGVWLDAGELEHLKGKSEEDFERLSLAKQAEIFDSEQAKARALQRRSAFYRFLWSMKEAARIRRRY